MAIKPNVFKKLTKALANKVVAGHYEVAFARSQIEIEASQALRYKVLFKEGNGKITDDMLALRREVDQWDEHAYHVIVTESTLSIGYSMDCAALTVDRNKIQTVEVLPNINPICDWGGYGIRKQLPSWDTGYIVKKGPGIRMVILRPNGKEAAYAFNCEDPERVASLLTTAV